MCAEGREAPGDPTSFDPVARYDDVSQFAGSGLKLTRITAQGVREDGTVDLEEDRYRTSVDYHFVRSVPPPDDAPPIGAGGADEWHQTVSVRLKRAGHTATVTDERGTRQARTKGMTREESDPEAGPVSEEDVMPAPRCSFAALWQLAKQQDVPSDAVAEISYGPEDKYRFRIADEVSLGFDQDCAPAELEHPWRP